MCGVTRRTGFLATLALLLIAAALAGVAGSASGAAAKARPLLPARVYAPFFQTWRPAGIKLIAQQSGVRYFTLAFVEATSRRSCVTAWNADPSQTVAGGRYLSGIAALRAMGGDVVPSFGGYSADHNGNEVGDSCHSLPDLVAAYKSVITTLNVTRVDMDVEDLSLGRTVAIDRRNKALRRVEDWAHNTGRKLQVEYTLPTTPHGLEADALGVLKNAKANGTRVDIVNIMTFDYYDGTTTRMGRAAITAAKGLHAQLHALYPHRTGKELWAMEGNTMLPGIDDYPAKTEVTHLPDVKAVRAFAKSVGISTLSTWAVQRDNGGCPGVIDSDHCSGLRQKQWAFSKALIPFTRG
jgi:hypothetical protein